METQKIYLGKWWIVNPNDQVYKGKDFSGTLSISERGKISLVLMVDFEWQFNDYFEFPVVNGIINDTEEGNCATLLIFIPIASHSSAITSGVHEVSLEKNRPPFRNSM
jgi:hypothetical protein